MVKSKLNVFEKTAHFFMFLNIKGKNSYTPRTNVAKQDGTFRECVVLLLNTSFEVICTFCVFFMNSFVRHYHFHCKGSNSAPRAITPCREKFMSK